MDKSDYERDCYFSSKELTHSDMFVQIRSLALAGRLNESNVDVGEDTTGGNGGVRKKLVELLIVAHSKLDVAGDDSALLGVLGGVASELENLGGKVLKDGSEVDRGTGTDAGGRSVLLQEASDTADGELKSGSLGLGGSTGGRSLSLSSSFSGHVKIIYKIILGSVYKEDGCAKFGSEIRQG